MLPINGIDVDSRAPVNALETAGSVASAALAVRTSAMSRCAVLISCSFVVLSIANCRERCSCDAGGGRLERRVRPHGHSLAMGSANETVPTRPTSRGVRGSSAWNVNL